MKDWLSKLLLLAISVAALGLVGIGLDDYLNNNDTNDCTMTYMYQDPGLVHIKLPIDGTGPFEYYKLYLYCEGQECADGRKKNVTFLPGHIPVLYVPGNGDSPLQVRSLASVALDKTRQLRRQRAGKVSDDIKFQFFTIDFQKELTGLYGPFLDIQTEYVKYCVNFIMALFDGIEPEEKRPTSVLLIGNSMGGAVARGIFLPSQMSITPTSAKKKTSSEMKKSKKNKEKVPVHTVITKSTPHKRPVVSLDEDMSDFYARLNDYWLNVNESSLENVVLVSLFGGHRDTMVRSELANVNEWRSQTSAGIVSAHTVSVPYVWKSIDHKCMAWCKELVLQIVRSLFDMIDTETGQITNDRAKREAILRHYFEKDAPIDQEKAELTKSKLSVLVDDLSMSQSEKRALKELARRHRLVKSEHLEEADYTNVNFEYNSFSPSNTTVHFDLSKVLATKAYDSLFVYTNIPDAYSLVMCKTLVKLGATEPPDCAPPAPGDSAEMCSAAKPPKPKADQQSGYNCTNYLDLFREYGRTIAAVDHLKHAPIRVINVVDLKKLVETDGYSSLLLTLPKRERSHDAHQAVVKLDWYLKGERTAEFNEMPGPLAPSVSLDLASLFKSKTGVTYRRLYLPKFNSVLQAYELVKKASKVKAAELAKIDKAKAKDIFCDDYLKIELDIRKSAGLGLPLAVSTLFVLFTEPVSPSQVQRSTEYVYSSQASLLSHKVLKLRLSANVLPNERGDLVVPYLEFIQFDIKHLLNHVSLKEKEKKNALTLLNECRTYDAPLRGKKDLVQLHVSYPSILAQCLRHYCPLVLAFLVLIIQSYDIINLTKQTQMSSSELDKYKSKLILHKYNVLFVHHLALSSLVTVLAYALQSDLFAKLVGLVDPNRSFVPVNDFELLKAEKLSNAIVPFVVYWSAFGIINLACLVLSNKLQTVAFVVHKIFAKLLDLSNEKLVKKVSSLHVMACILSNSQGSPLSQVVLVLGELIRLAFLNPNYYTNLDGTSSIVNEYVNYSNDVTRFVFYIVLLGLNVPSLVVWLNFVRIDSFGSLPTFIDDIGATFAILTLGLNLFAYFRRANRLDMLAVANKHLVKLLTLNAALTILYSSVSLYRLPYFILIHLFLMCLYDHKQPFELVEEAPAPGAKTEKTE